MKYLFIILTIFVSFTTFAQNEQPVKLDGTKYYLQVYDGETNEKVVYYNPAGAGWTALINVAEYFDGSEAQLWSFEESPNFPGYFLIRNRAESVYSTHSLMSWNWNAYLATDESRPPLNEMEKQFRFVEAFDGYYILETIEKPTDGSLYGINYTPGADALNVDENGVLSFKNVKSADITAENMANKVFKIVEFDPLKLFDESIVRGDELYNAYPTAPEQALYNLFYALEKAREVRVFGTEAEILAYQPVLDEALSQFNQIVTVLTIFADARAFISTAGADVEVTDAFNQIVDDAEAYVNSPDFVSSDIGLITTKIENATSLVEAIVAAQTYAGTLEQSLADGLTVSIDYAKGVLANSASTPSDYSLAISHLERTQEIIAEIIAANELIANTADYPDEKAVLLSAIDQIIAVINTVGTSVSDLDLALVDIQDAILVFQDSLGAILVLNNADFSSDFTDWNVESPTPGAAYAQNRGVDCSRSITWWAGSDYQMKVYQSISNIPNGDYKISCFYRNSAEGSIGLFAESGANSEDVPLPLYNTGSECELTKAEIEITVTDGTLRFGIRGQGVDNGVPAGNWIIFDEFKVQWASKYVVTNGGFDSDFTDWTVESPTPAAAYAQNRGVDCTRSITWWAGSDYQMKVFQSVGFPNGVSKVSCYYRNSAEGSIGLFAESGANSEDLPLPLYNTGAECELTKAEVEITVTDGTLSFGIRGQGTDNGVPAGNWIIFDDIEIAVKTIIPDYVVPAPIREQALLLDVETLDKDFDVLYSQNKKMLNIRSTDVIVKYSVYNITGALVEQKDTKSNELSVSLRQGGLYIVKVLTEKGFLDTKKIVVR